MTSSLSLLREPRSRPAGLPDSPGLPKVGGHVCAGALLLLGKCMIVLSIRQSALIDAIVARPFDPFQFEAPVRQGRAACAADMRSPSRLCGPPQAAASVSQQNRSYAARTALLP